MPGTRHTPLRPTSLRSYPLPIVPTPSIDPLDRLAPHLIDLTSEINQLLINTQKLEKNTEKLEEFADTLGLWIQSQKVQTYCVNFMQAPTDASFRLAAIREREDRERLKHRVVESPPLAPAQPLQETVSDASVSKIPTPTSSLGAKSVEAIPAAKRKPPAMSNKQKKERANAVENIVNLLPLEYRGNADLRKTVESVINRLMDAAAPIKISDIVKLPLLPQAKVNKCLIALVSCKAVKKTSVGGVSNYAINV